MRAYERLLKYVSYETTSDENSQTCPSSAKELVLADELVEELKAIGVMCTEAFRQPKGQRMRRR